MHVKFFYDTCLRDKGFQRTTMVEFFPEKADAQKQSPLL